MWYYHDFLLTVSEVLVFSALTISYTNNDDPRYEQHALLKKLRPLLEKGCCSNVTSCCLNY